MVPNPSMANHSISAPTISHRRKCQLTRSLLWTEIFPHLVIVTRASTWRVASQNLDTLRPGLVSCHVQSLNDHDHVIFIVGDFWDFWKLNSLTNSYFCGKHCIFFYKFLEILAYDPNASVLSCFDIALPVSVTLNLLVCHGSENPDIHSAISTP